MKDNKTCVSWFQNGTRDFAYSFRMGLETLHIVSEWETIQLLFHSQHDNNKTVLIIL